jgi:arsenate reductase-like glutaredoxin family protein
MNTYENELMSMLRQGMSFDEVMNKMHTQLSNAQAQIRAEEEAQRQAKLAEEKLANEAKAKAERETRAKMLVDIANRALEGTLTAEDVAAIQLMYAKQKITNESDLAILAELFAADTVDQSIDMALATAHSFDSFLKMFGTDWNQVINETSPEAKAAAHAKVKQTTQQNIQKMKRSDDAILKDFLSSLK